MWSTSCRQNGFSSIAISLSWIADVVSPQNRSAAFGIILAVFSLCMVVGPPTSTSMPQNTALLVSTGSSAVAVLYALVVLPESLPPELRKQSIAGLVNPLKSTQILLKTALFRRLTVCVLFQTMSGNGLQDVLVYYLEDQVGVFLLCCSSYVPHRDSPRCTCVSLVCACSFPLLQLHNSTTSPKTTSLLPSC